MAQISPKPNIKPSIPSNLQLMDENIDPFYHRIYSRKVVVVLCYGQVVIAFLAIVSQFIGLAYPYEGYGYANAGISCGIIFGISGLFGIWAGNHPSKCTIITHMVFAIISACFSILLIIYAVIFSVVIADVSYPTYNEWEPDLNLGIFITLAVMGLIQSIISIATSALSCSVICCNDQSMNRDTHVPDTQNTKKLIMSKKPVLWMSVMQIIAAVLAMILNIVGIVYPYEDIAYIGTGIWSAVPFILCGAFGIWSGLRPSKCSVITFMVFSIISTFFALALLGISTSGIVITNKDHYSYAYSYITHSYMFEKWDTERKVTFGMFFVQTFIGVLQTLISINSSAMSCQPICCPTKNYRKITEDHAKAKRLCPTQSQNDSFYPQHYPTASTRIPAKPFRYNPPDQLVYLSGTNASLGEGGMRVQSTSNTPDIF